MEKLSETEIEKIVEDVLTSPCNMIKMLLKYEKRATYQIDHGCLHLAKFGHSPIGAFVSMSTKWSSSTGGL